MYMNKAPFIALEGIGGSGKSGTWKRVGAWLNAQAVPLTMVREPGGTPHAEYLRQLVNTGFPGIDTQLDPMGVALLFNACRIDLVNKVIRPALDQGQVVLTDRFCDTTFVYQSVFNGLEQSTLQDLHKDVIGLYPNWTYLLDCPGEVANARVSDAEKQRDQFDRAGIEKQEAMRQAYLSLARTYPGRYVVIDATKSEDEVFQEIINHLCDTLILRGFNVQRPPSPEEAQAFAHSPDPVM